MSEATAWGSGFMFGEYEVFVQLALLGLIVLAGPLVIFALYLRGADM